MRPSRFGVMSLLVLLALGCGLNLYIAFNDVMWGPEPEYAMYRHPNWPTRGPLERIPEDLKRQGAAPTEWQSIEWMFMQSSGIWLEDLSALHGIPIRVDQNGDPLFAQDAQPRLDTYLFHETMHGAPFTTRSTKYALRDEFDKPADQVWPTASSTIEPAVTYHPLGLILNPIIYALPIWLIVMGVRWAFVTRRSRKRARLGLCVGCAYELTGLGVCPECGRGRA